MRPLKLRALRDSLPRANAAALVAGALLLAGAPSALRAAEVAGVRFADQATVASKPLVLNGTGVRYKAVFKVYAAGLYLPHKTQSAEEILHIGAEPRRLQLTMLRDIDSAEFGKMFYRGMEDNMDRNSFAKLVPGVLRMSQVFTDFKKSREGDVITIDWVPGTGMLIGVNGKPASEPFKEPEFFTALLRIWLGSKPADWKLKDALLGKGDASPAS